MTVRIATSEGLTPEEVGALRQLFDEAWRDHPDGAFTDDDWDHATGGLHFICDEEGMIVAHASVVERDIHAGEHPLATGYVEAVATRPGHERRGYGSAVIRAVGDHIDGTFQLGALATGSPGFYERLGWTVWKGPTFVRSEGGLVRTPEEDGSILVRLTPATPDLDFTAPISCDWRSGDVW